MAESLEEPKPVLYVTNLSFMDADSKTIMMQPDEAQLLDKAVVRGIKQAKKLNQKIQYNAPGHSIKNNDSNVSRLADIIYDPTITPLERRNKIEEYLIIKHNVDVIVSGQYLDKNSKIIVRPIVILKNYKKIAGKTLTFPKQDFICPDPASSRKKYLCPETHEEIAKAVKELLMSL